MSGRLGSPAETSLPHPEWIVKRNEMVHEYLKALGLHDRELDFGFLSEVAACHVAEFPFSNVGCLLGEALPLDVASLFDRIVVQRRGGYCFEQNGLLFEVLEELGFSPELYLARVIYNQDVHPGLTHRISIVNHEDRRYVLDVGFGPLGPRIPVHLSENESIDGEKVFRVSERHPGEYHMQVFSISLVQWILGSPPLFKRPPTAIRSRTCRNQLDT